MIVEQSKQIIEEVGKAFIGNTDLVDHRRSPKRKRWKKRTSY